jgi:undecaprenyl-diphosphatase
MGYLDAIILGLVQGVTEFLPVSSSGHLTLCEMLLRVDLEDNVALDVALHAATLASIVVYFGRAWMKRARAEPRLAVLALAAGVPAGVFYLVAVDSVEAAKGNIWIVGAMFIIAGAFLVFASLAAARMYAVSEGSREEDASHFPSGKSGVMAVAGVGIAQATALLPGISRSGTTIGAGLLMGLSREAAFEFSFLTATPLLAGAVLVKAHEIGRIVASSGGELALGSGVAFVSGVAALVLLRRIVTGGKLWIFGIYTIVVGITCFGLAAGGVI